jgi:hypothetical protein
MTRRTDPGPQSAALREFIERRKFEPGTFYPGAVDEASRAGFQSIIDALAMRLLPLADRPPNPATVLAEFRITMAGMATSTRSTASKARAPWRR